MIGPLIGADEVCGAVETTLTTWLPSVLAEINAAHSTALTLPTTYDMPDARSLQSGSAEIPAVVVSSAGVTGTPERDPDGMYRASWTVIVSAFARGDDYRNTAQNVRGYALAVRTCLLQHPSLGGFASEVVWTGEEYAALASESARTIGGAFVTFTVTVDDVIDATAGPAAPPTTPTLISPDDPTVLTTELLVTKETP